MRPPASPPPRWAERLSHAPSSGRLSSSRSTTTALSRRARQLLYALAACGLLSLTFVWYLHVHLPAAKDERDRGAVEESVYAQPSPEFCSKRRPTRVVAHGGDTTHAPPNTAAAFQAALDFGADCVEIDAALSKDGVLVVLHVRELAQLLGGRHGVQVGDLEASELLALRWPGPGPGHAGGQPVMSVADAVRLTSPFADCVVLDIKTYQDEAGQPRDELAIADALVLLVHETRCTNCIMWAKSDTLIDRIRELSPGQRTGYVVMNDTAESQALHMYEPLRLQGRHSVVALQHAMVDPGMRDLLHDAGKEVFAFTLNDARDLKRVLDVGVDAVVTNYPALALAAIGYRLTQCGSSSDL